MTNGWGSVPLDSLFYKSAMMAKPDWFSEKVELVGGSPANQAEIDKTQVVEKKKKGFSLPFSKKPEQSFFVEIECKASVNNDSV